MYTSLQHLKRKTPCPGVNRQEFIEHLVNEYYTTTDIEAQEQVTANLANFAYDPINWEYLNKSDAVKLFLELLDSPNEKLKLHGISGLCNICLDHESSTYIRKLENFRIIHQLLKITQNEEILLNCLLIIYQFLPIYQDRQSILPGEVLRRIQHISTVLKSNKRLNNVATLLLERFGKRYEFVEESSK